MKKIILLMTGMVLSSIIAFSQVAINSDGSGPDASAGLDVKFTGKGFLLPRLTTAQRNSIASPATGLIIYNTGMNRIEYYGGSVLGWAPLLTPSNGWSVTGNPGTTDGTSFIGTTDNVPFNIRVNNQKSGRIDPLLFNTFFGYQAGNSTTGGMQNTAAGYGSLLNNITGAQNTAIGYFSNVGSGNLMNATAIGANAIAGASNSLVLGSNANVGIGISVPSEQLHTTLGVRHESLSGTGIRPVMADATGKLLTQSSSAFSGTTSPGLAIPDNSCTGISSSVILSGLPVNIPTSGIAVTINITHTWDADVLAYLVAPNSQVINLLYGTGASTDNFTNTTFTDVAPNTIYAGTAPFTGYFKPAGSMFFACSISPTVSTFAALGGGTIDPNGMWTLRVFDNSIDDTGILNNWSINLLQGSSGNSNYIPRWLDTGTLSGMSDIYDNGMVGIGTTNPQHKLEVNGNIRQTVYNSGTITIPANGSSTLTFNHNFGYQPVIIITKDQTGGGYMDYVETSYSHINNNALTIYLTNRSASAASGVIRWIVVY